MTEPNGTDALEPGIAAAVIGAFGVSLGERLRGFPSEVMVFHPAC